MTKKVKETPQNVNGGEVGEGPRGTPIFRIIC
jgi:hypothetical protein